MAAEQTFEKLERALETYTTQVDFWLDRGEALLDHAVCTAIMATTFEVNRS